MTLNYEQYDVPDKMVEDLDANTLEDVRKSAMYLDALFLEHAEKTMGAEEIDALSEEVEAHIYETLKFFADYYEGKSMCLMLSGLLHAALTLIYTCSYEMEQAKMKVDLRNMGMVGDDDQA